MRTKDARALARIRSHARHVHQSVAAASADSQTLQLIPANAHALALEAKRLEGLLTDRLNGWEDDR